MPKTVETYRTTKAEVQVDRASEALDRGDATGLRIGRSAPSGEPALAGEDGAGEEVEEAGGQLGAAGREEADLARHGQHPLPEQDGRGNAPDQGVSPLGDPDDSRL